MKKLIMLIMTLTAIPVTLFAYGSTRIGNLYYHLDWSTKTAELTNEYAKYSRSLTTINIPSVVRDGNVNYTVIGIGDNTFFGCDWVTSITIPNTVTTIGSGAFGHCSSLTSLTIPNSVESIGGDAFSYCTGITSLTIPNSVTSIGSNAFGQVNNVIYEGAATGSPWGAKCVNGYVEDGLVYPDNSKAALLGCSSAATGDIVIPNSVTSIGDYAFYGCSSITSINISDQVTSIGRCAFRGCSGLTSIIIPNSVKTIGLMAFYECTGIPSLTIPNSVTSIGDYAFYCVNNIIYGGTATGSPWKAKYVNGYVEEGWVFSDNTKTTLVGCCSAVTGDVVVPNSVTAIEKYAFYNCSKITSCIVSDNVTRIGYIGSDSYAFGKCSNLQSITIPNSVTNIGSHSFDRCDSLKSIKFNADYIMSHVSFSGSSNFNTMFGNQIEECIFGDSVTRINSYTFYRCTNLKSVIIPNSATKIGDYVFYGCTNLTSITNYATTPQKCYTNDFTSVDKSTCTLYVPEESIELYQNTDGWKDFTNIVKIPVIWNVTFVDYDESVLSVQEVEDGEAAEAPSTPTREGYTFTGWDKEFNNVTEDMTIKAEYEINHFEVRFLDWNNDVLKSEQVDWHSSATAPANPYRAGYTFAGWDKDYSDITADLDVNAQYEFGENTNFTVYFNDKNGDEILSSAAVLKVPAAPEIEGFTFLGWKPVASFITNAIEIQAIYQSDTPTDSASEVVNPSNKAQKLIRQGNVYILTEDRTYTIQGQQIK